MKPSKRQVVPLTKYITDPVKIRLLLAKYPLLKVLLGNLKIELQTAYRQGTGMIGTPEEIMEAMAIGSKPYSDMPHVAPTPGDSMTVIVQNYPKVMEKELKALLETIEKEIANIEDVVKKIDIAMSNTLLNKNQRREIITQKYFYGASWKEIENKLNITSKQSKTEHRAAIEQLCLSIKISAESYAFVMELVELENERLERLEKEKGVEK